MATMAQITNLKGYRFIYLNSLAFIIKRYRKFFLLFGGNNLPKRKA